MAQGKHPPGPPMDLANVRRQAVHHLIAYCLNDACRHQAIIDVSKYPDDVEVPWFHGRIKCGKCGLGRCAAELEGAAGQADEAQVRLVDAAVCHSRNKRLQLYLTGNWAS